MENMDEVRQTTNAGSQYNGIGGWLILVAIGAILNPLRLSIMIFVNFVPVFQNNTWSILTTPGTAAYHRLWAPLILFELFGNILFVIFSIIIAICFFQKKRFFPKLMIVFLLANLIFIGIDLFAANFIPAVAAQNDEQSNKELARVILASIIWIPYFMVSIRVKETFVR
jgi:hypothetical protein